MKYFIIIILIVAYGAAVWFARGWYDQQDIEAAPAVRQELENDRIDEVMKLRKELHLDKVSLDRKRAILDSLIRDAAIDTSARSKR